MKFPSLKTVLLSLTMVTTVPSWACTITPSGDSGLRVNTLLGTLGMMEQMTGFVTIRPDLYRVSVHDHETNQDVIRTYRLENTSPMCPVYKAILIE